MSPKEPLHPSLEAVGFPSPAADFVESGISLDKTLISRRNATFFFRASGDDLKERGIFDGDLLVVDRSLTPEPGRVVVAVADGEFLLRPYGRELAAQHGDIIIWGVVKWAIHQP